MPLSHSGLPLLSRRTVLTGIASWATSQLLLGCNSATQPPLKVQFLQGSIPSQLLNQFHHQLQQANRDTSVSLLPVGQLQTLFSRLQGWQTGNPANQVNWVDWIPLIGDRANKERPDLVTLGHYWLDKAIAQQVIQSLDTSALKQWPSLESRWQQLVTRNGQVWAAPYRWGTTMIAYRRDIFQQRRLPPISDWADLWRSDLRGQISLPDQAREVIGLTLKKLGHSYNTDNLKAVEALDANLRSLHANLKFYSSTNYLQPLRLGDTWVAVGWSSDLMPLVEQNNQIALVVPRSGTALWADLWVRPSRNDAQSNAVAHAWIDFCWQLEAARTISLLTAAVSPALDLQQAGQEVMRAKPDLAIPSSTLAASEFIQPLTRTVEEEYQDLWQRVRTV